MRRAVERQSIGVLESARERSEPFDLGVGQRCPA